MLSSLSSIIQAITIFVGTILGVIGTLSKREEGSLKRSDKVALVGIVVAGVLALSALTVDVVQKDRDRKAELNRIGDEITRQTKLLSEVRRGLHSITDFSAGVEFTVPASNPKLAGIVARWEKYIKTSRSSQFDEKGYSRDGKIFAARDEHNNIRSLYIDPGSALFPAPNSIEHRILLPILSLAVLRPDAPEAVSLVSKLDPLGSKDQYTDLSLFMPLTLADYETPESGERGRQARSTVFARIMYDRTRKLITVYGDIKPATAAGDTGAIISLMDLPGRQIVLLGLRKNVIDEIKMFKLTASVGNGRFWSGHKEVRGKDITISSDGDAIVASYRLKKEDFTGLASSQTNQTASSIP